MGVIPMDSSGTRLQINVITPTSFVGADPLQNPVSGTGSAVVTGTVTVTIWYRDYHSFTHTAGGSLVLAGMPTIQTLKVNEINPLTAGSYQYVELKNPYAWYRYVSLVIDGNQSDKFTSLSNLQGYRLNQAGNNLSAFFVYDATQGGVNNYYKSVRKVYGRDYDSGVIFYDSATQNLADASLREGQAFLNMSASGYPNAQLGVQVGSVSSSNGITPRLVTYAVVQNPAGIR